MGCRQSKAKEPVTARQSTIARKNTEHEEKDNAPFAMKSAKNMSLDIKPPPVKAIPKITPKHAQRKASSKKFT
ncbi:conserved Plasmodium protein, unknown function [Plasmodium vinckei vinckei]|uniref:Uncharacterized protein n=1 Tax=Plasmodium vinckei vinckei TaxID=54757 RepID=A0A449BR84_PLAVN|nr:conserved Plasmodium protein, unknown function [Plasmodium vinckei vinckei]VEV55961.1 conserved Plasmodium protein, unknown function [Plasmodium vinckei vinckei]